MKRSGYGRRAVVCAVLLCLCSLLPGACKANLSKDEQDLRYEQDQKKSERLAARIRLPLEVLPKSWTADHVLTDSERFLLSQVSEGLTGFSAEGRIRPLQAESIEASDNKQHWTIRLRADLHWSDGTTISAEDYRRSWLENMAPDSAAQTAYGWIIKGARDYHEGRAGEETVGIKAAGRTIEIELVRPFERMDAWLSAPFFFPHKIDDKGKDLFNGAYVPEQSGEQIILRKNENYWDAVNVHLPEAVLTVEKDAVAAFEKYRSGIYDAIGEPVYPIARERREYAAAQPEALVFKTGNPGYFCLYPERHALFEDAERRQALYALLDPMFLTSGILFDASPAFPERETPKLEEIREAGRILTEKVDDATLEAWKEAPLVGLAGPQMTEYRLLVASTKEWLSALRLRLYLERVPGEDGREPAIVYEKAFIPSGVAEDWALLLPDDAVTDGDFAQLPETAAILPLHLRNDLLLCHANVRGLFVTPSGTMSLADLLVYEAE